MATVSLKNVKKIYPYGRREEKKQAQRTEQDRKEDEKSPKLQHTAEGVVAVQDFNLDIADREFVVLVGPSGCGKSTTLRMIAGLEEISSGELLIGGKRMNEVAPKDRDIAMVFQNYALYPHMTVYENMAFALTLRKMDKAMIDKKVREAAEILDLTPYLSRKPKALSGGQRQRVAIGRAIVRDPQVFLMDEPLSNLDAKLRNQMRAEIIKLRQRIQTTFVYVTHDQTEAMTLGDRIVIMRDGFIMQVGTPQDVFNHPANLFVAGFIGMPQMNFFKAELKKDGGRYLTLCNGVAFPLSDRKQELLNERHISEGPIILGVRPEHIMLCDEHAIQPHLVGKVVVSEMMGSTQHLHVACGDEEIVIVIATVDLPDDHRDGFKIGEEVNFTFGEKLPHLFDPKTEKNLLN